MNQTSDGRSETPPEIPTSEIVALLRERLPSLDAVYLFGSTAEGSALPGSDLDIAVLAGRPLEATERFELQIALAVLVRQDVDLVDLLRASDVLRIQVIANGALLFARDRQSVEAFEAYALSSYARLNEERRDILEQAQREGSVYGR
ncbi:MAG TPA: nucleotidyltransferase domain-containing protein [Thermoanaerobaculia bacterium]|nr:nucleotidyltransferase domain-containing protein [Thermoanaerobaculia bacterium]